MPPTKRCGARPRRAASCPRRWDARWELGAGGPKAPGGVWHRVARRLCSAAQGRRVSMPFPSPGLGEEEGGRFRWLQRLPGRASAVGKGPVFNSAGHLGGKGGAVTGVGVGGGVRSKLRRFPRSLIS